MTINFSIQYGQTELFDAGTREITMEWKQEFTPSMGCQIDVVSIIDDKLLPEEEFVHHNRTRNVFEYIEQIVGWRISDIRIGHYKNSPQVTYIVTEHSCLN